MFKPGAGQKHRSPVHELEFEHPAGRQAEVQLVHLSELRRRELDVQIDEPARHAFHVIQLVTSGRGRYWVDFETLDVELGDVIYLRPGQIHAFDRSSAYQGLLLVFRSEALHEPSGLHPIDPRLPRLRPAARDFDLLADLATQLDALLHRDVSVNVHQLGRWLLAAITSAIGEVARSQVPARSDSPRQYFEVVYAFERMLEIHYAERHRMGWFASRLETTERRLGRACQAVRGRSPKQLADAQTALEARRRLLLYEDLVEQVAEDLGFSEATNFVKFFRRTTGMTPTAFRGMRARKSVV
ncbi:MAG: helix-turn-helix transcriptional regulator [Acidobacteriota bacterium]